MVRKFAVLVLVFTIAVVGGLAESAAQDKEKKKNRTGTVSGELKSRKDTPNGKNVILEILGAGEEKARPYRVQYDPKAKGPIAEVLAAAKAAKIGDRVLCDWIDTGEGLAVTTFQVQKTSAKKDDGKDKK